MLLALLLEGAFAGVCLIYAYAAHVRIRRLEAENAGLRSLPQASDTADLVGDFRNFVEAIDGHVSPEMNELLGRIQAQSNATKALPAPEPKENLTEAMFWTEYESAYFDDARIKILEQWKKRLVLTPALHRRVFKRLEFDSAKTRASVILSEVSRRSR